MGAAGFKLFEVFLSVNQKTSIHLNYSLQVKIVLSAKRGARSMIR
jgi:hypothetical protein